MQGRETGTAGASHHGLEQLQLELGAGANGTSPRNAGAWHGGWLVPRWLGLYIMTAQELRQCSFTVVATEVMLGLKKRSGGAVMSLGC